MTNIDLNEPINWDDIDDFDGEAREFAGDFFFEVESDSDSDEEEEIDGEDEPMMVDAPERNGRVRGTLGLTGLRAGRRFASSVFEHGESSGGRRGHADPNVDESSGGHGPLFNGEPSHNRSTIENEQEPIRLSDGVFVFVFRGQSSGGRVRLGLSGRGRGSCPPFRSAGVGRGHAGAGREPGVARGGPGRGAAGRGAAGARERGGRGRGATRRGAAGAGGRGGRGRGAVGRGAAGVAGRGGQGRGAAGRGAAGADEHEPDEHGNVVPLGRLVNACRVHSDEDK